VIAGHHVCPQFSRRGGHHRIYHVARTGTAEQTPSQVRSLLGQAHDVTTAEQPAELDLRRRSADLNDDRSGHHRNDARLQPYSVLRPYTARIPVRMSHCGMVASGSDFDGAYSALTASQNQPATIQQIAVGSNTSRICKSLVIQVRAALGDRPPRR
jgi:hypothetical protein